jgi:microcystin-dependent protein
MKYWDENAQAYVELGLRGVQGPPGPAGDAIPTGHIMAFAGLTPAAGWLMCDGSAVLRSAYPNLFAVISTRFGAGDGSTTFNLPNLQDRVPVGASGTKAVGSAGGESAHTTTVAEMPNHAHNGVTAGGTTGGGTSGNTDTDHYHAGTTNAADRSLDHLHTAFNTPQGYWNGGLATGSLGPQSWLYNWANSATTGMDRSIDHLHTFTTNWQSQQYATNNHSHSIPGLSVPGLGIPANGGGAAHNNMQPYVAMNYVIKY